MARSLSNEDKKREIEKFIADHQKGYVLSKSVQNDFPACSAKTLCQWIRDLYGQAPQEFFINRGVIITRENEKDEFCTNVINQLKKIYKKRSPAKDIEDLIADNPSLPIYDFYDLLQYSSSCIKYAGDLYEFGILEIESDQEIKSWTEGILQRFLPFRASRPFICLYSLKRDFCYSNWAEMLADRKFDRFPILFGCTAEEYFQNKGVLLSASEAKSEAEKSLKILAKHFTISYTRPNEPSGALATDDELDYGNFDLIYYFTQEALSAGKSRDEAREYVKQVFIDAGIVKGEMSPEALKKKNDAAQKDKSMNTVKPPHDVSANPIIDFCYENFDVIEIKEYLEKHKIEDSVFAKVKFLGSNELAPVFVVECAIVPYMKQLVEIPKRVEDYKKDYSKFEIDPIADKIAESLDKETFQLVFDSLLGTSLPSAVEVLVPYGRYASVKQITTLQSRLKDWASWSTYGARGRSAIIIAHGALLLNDSREAMLIADKLGMLKGAALIRNTSEDLLRAKQVSDFSFDASGKKQYNLGNTTIEISLANDFTLQMVDVGSGKKLKSIPKKGNDEEKIAIAAAEIADAKKNIKTVVTKRIAILKEEFLHDIKHSACDWKDTYVNNPVLRKVGELIVWSVEDASVNLSACFMINEAGKFVDADEGTIDISDNATISVAHPMTMDPKELEKWKNLLNKKSIVQPFTQIFEPLYNCDLNGVKERYKGVELPYYLLKSLEKEGYVIDGGFGQGYHWRYNYDIKLFFIVRSENAITFKSIPLKDNVKLWDFIVAGRRVPPGRIVKVMTKVINHALYLIDGLCLESAARKNDIEALSLYKDCLTGKNIHRFIDIAEETKSTDCLLWLVDYKNEKFPNAVDDSDL